MAVREPVGLEATDGDRREQGVDAAVAETQSGHASPVDEGGLVDGVEHGVADDRVVTDRLGVEETPVGGEADLPQDGQVAQSFADPEVPGVVDGHLGAKGSSFLVILLDPTVPVLDVKVRDDPGVNTRVRNRVGVGRGPWVRIWRWKISDTRSGRPISRFSRMTSSKNARPEAGRSSIWVKENSAWRIDTS